MVAGHTHNHDRWPFAAGGGKTGGGQCPNEVLAGFVTGNDHYGCIKARGCFVDFTACRRLIDQISDELGPDHGDGTGQGSFVVSIDAGEHLCDFRSGRV